MANEDTYNLPKKQVLFFVLYRNQIVLKNVRDSLFGR